MDALTCNGFVKRCQKLDKRVREKPVFSFFVAHGSAETTARKLLMPETGQIEKNKVFHIISR